VRSRKEAEAGKGDWRVVEARAAWDPSKTAAVVCDMWDRHWCAGATARVAEMAPRMNDLLVALRRQGALVIHCPSDTMNFYADHPGRKLALAAPKAETAVPLQGWCRLDPARESPLPIDDADGGCADDPPCKQGKAWSRQIDVLKIEEGDGIADGPEAFHLMKQRGITNVLVMGVHTNMCVLGRPFAIRQLVKQGMQVALVRDLTDTMYNPKSRPFVDHFAGTDLVVGHIEKFWCPTVTSDQILGGAPFRFAGDKGKIVLPRLGGRRVASYRCGVDLTTGQAEVVFLEKLVSEEDDLLWKDMRKDVSIGGRTFTIRIEDIKGDGLGSNWARVSVVEVDGKDGTLLRTIPVREFAGGHGKHGFRGLALKGDRLSVFVSFWRDD
jgi:nicotinamidase-related amidase